MANFEPGDSYKNDSYKKWRNNINPGKQKYQPSRYKNGIHILKEDGLTLLNKNIKARKSTELSDKTT